MRGRASGCGRERPPRADVRTLAAASWHRTMDLGPWTLDCVLRSAFFGNLRRPLRFHSALLARSVRTYACTNVPVRLGSVLETLDIAPWTSVHSAFRIRVRSGCSAFHMDSAFRIPHSALEQSIRTLVYPYALAMNSALASSRPSVLAVWHSALE